MQRAPTSEETRYFYEAVGQGIWYLQFLEDALNKYLTIRLDLKTPGAVSQEQAHSALQKRNKATLGAAIKAGRESAVFPDNLLARLEVYVEERNWLVHRCLDTSGDSLYTDTGRTALLERIVNFVEESKALQKLIMLELEQFAAAQGVDTAASARSAHIQVARLRGEA